MDINLPLILVIAVFVTGGLWLLDILVLAPKRLALASENPAATDETDALKEPWVIEQAKSFFPVLALVFVLRSFLAEPFQIPSGSMIPTLEVGDFILVNKFHYGIRLPVINEKIISINEPKRGDVMVFFPPHDSRYFIKRVIGLPGDHIEYKNKTLFINGKEMTQEFMSSRTLRTVQGNIDEVTFSENLGQGEHVAQKFRNVPNLRVERTWDVPAGHYFMMGDNRDNSHDSRGWDDPFVPDENIVGKAVAVWMHWEGWSELPSFGTNKWID
jgi:signal peptidase I